jgi:hypothetical protein
VQEATASIAEHLAVLYRLRLRPEMEPVRPREPELTSTFWNLPPASWPDQQRDTVWQFE